MNRRRSLPIATSRAWRNPTLMLATGVLLAACAGKPTRPDPLEAPPLLLAVPAGPAAKPASSSEPAAAGARTTAVATLDELVVAVAPSAAGAAASAAPVAASAPRRRADSPSPLVPAAAVEQDARAVVGAAPALAAAAASAAVGAGGARPAAASGAIGPTTAPMAPPLNGAAPVDLPAVGSSTAAAAGGASAASTPASANPSAATSATAPAGPTAAPASAIGRPADSAGTERAIGPVVAPPLPGAAPAAATPASDAAGEPTDPLEGDRTPDPDDAQAFTDLWQRIREGYAMPDLDGPLVKTHERWYQQRPDYVQRMTERGSRYLFHIVEEVSKRGMPTELALLPFIESAYNPQAMSVAKASGMWQFIPSTGKNYDLAQNVFRDDRRDVLESTRAALDYLGRLHEMFGDWRLALAAYNWGEGNVAKAIARNKRARKPTDYTSLRMPAETRSYVPKLQAVKNIVTAPERYGLSLPELRNHPYFLSVPIYRDMDVALAARLALMEEEDFRTLNPAFDKPVILAAGTPRVLLPYDNADEFVRNLANWQGPLATWTAWQLPRTVKPAEAARIIGVDEAQLRTVNRIPGQMLIKAGSVLLVPRDDAVHSDVADHLADNGQLQLLPDGPLLRRVVYRAGRGDGVASMARRYRVNASQLAQWNQVDTNAHFAPGQAVVIYVPSAAGRSAKAGTRHVRTARHASPAATKAGPAKAASGKPHTAKGAKPASHTATR